MRLISVAIEGLYLLGGYKWWILSDIDNFDPTFNGKLKKAVYQVALLDKTIINRFESVSEAARTTCQDKFSIIKCCTQRQLATNGYRWCYAKDYDQLPYKVKELTRYRMIKATDVKTNECVGTFIGASEASKQLHVSYQSVVKGCNGIIKSPRKYIFEYVDE